MQIIYTLFNCIKYSYVIQKTFKQVYLTLTLTGTSTLCVSGPGSNGNERVLHTPQISRNIASHSDAVKHHTWVG